MTPIRLPRAWTFRESASLLGLGYRNLKVKVQRGEIRARIDEWYIRPPGTAHAYRRRRGYITTAELNRWMKAQEEKTEEARVARAGKARSSNVKGGDTAKRSGSRAGQSRRSRGSPASPSRDIASGCF